MVEGNPRQVPDHRLTVIRPAFMALFDAADTIAPWDEGRWEQFIHAIDEFGRLVFGYPHLDTDRSDIFAVLDDFATGFREASKDLRAARDELLAASEPRAKIPDPITDESPPSAAEPPQILLALKVTTEEPPEPELVATPPGAATRTRPVRPLSPVTVPCDPGCGLPFGQTEIAAHRRECEAVARYKEERGVRVVPSLASAAPLPAVPDSDFAEKRAANARAASEASWQQRNPSQLHGSDVHLTDNEKRVLDALRKTSGNQAEANEVLGYERGSARVAAAISRLRETKRLPADVEELLRGAKRPPRKAASS